MKQLNLTDSQELHLTLLLNWELRTVHTGPCADALNGLFHQLCGRDHDVYAWRNAPKESPALPAPSPQVS